MNQRIPAVLNLLKMCDFLTETRSFKINDAFKFLSFILFNSCTGADHRCKSHLFIPYDELMYSVYNKNTSVLYNIFIYNYLYTRQNNELLHTHYITLSIYFHDTQKESSLLHWNHRQVHTSILALCLPMTGLHAAKHHSF